MFKHNIVFTSHMLCSGLKFNPGSKIPMKTHWGHSSLGEYAKLEWWALDYDSFES